jgi:hypothetical protein
MSSHDDTTTEVQLRAEARRLFAPLRIRSSRREVWDAFKANPEGVERCLIRANQLARQTGSDPVGYLVTMIRSGDHLREIDSDPRPITGWRAVYGESHAAMSYVEDREGRDQPPTDYDFTIHEHPPTWNEEKGGYTK